MLPRFSKINLHGGMMNRIQRKIDAERARKIFSDEFRLQDETPLAPINIKDSIDLEIKQVRRMDRRRDRLGWGFE